MLTRRKGICRKVREWRHSKKRPTPGNFNKSKGAESAIARVGLEGVDNVLSWPERRER
jgi:hypothetical protein